MESKWQGIGFPLPNSLRAYGPVREDNLVSALTLEWWHFCGTIESLAETLKRLPPERRAELRTEIGEFADALEYLIPRMRRFLAEVRGRRT